MDKSTIEELIRRSVQGGGGTVDSELTSERKMKIETNRSSLNEIIVKVELKKF